MLLVPELPWTTLRLVGVAEIVNDGAAAIVSKIVAVLVTLPEVPVTVMLLAPVAAVPPTARVRTPVELKEPVTPAGIPETDTVTLPEKPF